MFFWVHQLSMKYIDYLRISTCLAVIHVNIILSITKCKHVPGGWRQLLVSYLPPVEELPVSATHTMPLFFRAEQQTVRKSVKQRQHVQWYSSSVSMPLGYRFVVRSDNLTITASLLCYNRRLCMCVCELVLQVIRIQSIKMAVVSRAVLCSRCWAVCRREKKTTANCILLRLEASDDRGLQISVTSGGRWRKCWLYFLMRETCLCMGTITLPCYTISSRLRICRAPPKNFCIWPRKALTFRHRASPI